MGGHELSDPELLKRIAALWLRHRGQPMVTANVPQRLREVLDEAVRRVDIDQPQRSTDETPTETPSSRRK
jgi:hypothetical protein